MKTTKRDSTSVTNKGEVSARKIDSIRKANPAAARAIGKGYRDSGNKVRYGADQSDAIRAALKKRK